LRESPGGGVVLNPARAPSWRFDHRDLGLGLCAAASTLRSHAWIQNVDWSGLAIDALFTLPRNFVSETMFTMWPFVTVSDRSNRL
jgi:hypothetical protein